MPLEPGVPLEPLLPLVPLDEPGTSPPLVPLEPGVPLEPLLPLVPLGHGDGTDADGVVPEAPDVLDEEDDDELAALFHEQPSISTQRAFELRDSQRGAVPEHRSS